MTAPLIDRVDAVAAAGVRIARARSADEVRAAVRDAGWLLGAADCAVVELAGDPPRPAAPAGSLCGALVDAALRAGRPVAWPGVDVAISDPAAPRSALCAVIECGGRPTAALYATHAARAGAFGDDERRIAGHLAGFAGAALDAAAEIEHGARQLAAVHDQLFHAGRMAAIGTLFAGLSHELNNPLTVIVGNIDNLRLLIRPDDPSAKVIDAIERQATRAARLVNALLRFSHGGSLGHEPVLPDELIRLVVDLLGAEARRREIDLRVSVADGLGALFVVRLEIESALVNITINALQATPAGGVVELSVIAESRDEAPGVRFVLRDTGSGIPPDILPQIFDPFFTTKAEGEGTGLGLSLAREIAVSHGGDLSVDSEVGRGTTMSLWLPQRASGPRSRRPPTR